MGVKDFTLEEVEESFRPSFLDPGRKTVYTAAIGLHNNQHEIRRCTTKEYYHLTGSTVYSKLLKTRKDAQGITQIESAIPSSKTANSNNLKTYAQYMLTNLNVLFNFYEKHTAKEHFNLYQGRQRAPEIMVNMLLHGTSKYNKNKRLKGKEKKRKKRSRKKKRDKKKLKKGDEKQIEKGKEKQIKKGKEKQHER